MKILGKPFDHFPAAAFSFGALLLAAILLAAPATAAERYPVWWSPILELESLDAIDERLARIITKGSHFDVTRERNGAIEKAVMDSCASIALLEAGGFSPPSSNAVQIKNIVRAECRAIEFLRTAEPARVSFVHNLRLNPEIIPLLPAMMQRIVDCGTRLNQRDHNADRRPYVEFVEILEIHSFDGNSLEFFTSSSHVTISLLGRGDMNFDGLEDLVINVRTGATGGTAFEPETYLVTRDNPEGALYVADAASPRYVCKNYRRRR